MNHVEIRAEGHLICMNQRTAKATVKLDDPSVFWAQFESCTPRCSECYKHRHLIDEAEIDPYTDDIVTVPSGWVSS